MREIIEDIKRLFESSIGLPLTSIEKIPQSGSDRSYFRIHAEERSFIATRGENIRENLSFIYFTRHFRSLGCPLPEVICVNEANTLYIQQDLGNISLLNKFEQLGHTEEVYRLYQQSLRQLAFLQINGDQGLDYSQCITSKEFGKQAIMSDLLYFKYYFLDTLQLPYDKEVLLENFETLAGYLARADHKYFMFRDFQSRNIMINDGRVYFIDYQGGMKGALQYDAASLLWQAKAELPEQWKTSLLTYYMDCVEERLGGPIDRSRFTSQYDGYVLIRLVQVLGAYGFRGLFEKKAHFLTSIPLALNNLKSFLNNQHDKTVSGELERILNLITEENIISRFTPIQATAQTPLKVKIKSFSFKKGMPYDESGNGGGYVFDCRGILNPGRFESYKALTGRDKPVQDFLEQQTKMPGFLNSVYALVDISVEDYIKRNFESLQVSFGCTGGQHRSVYAADCLARYLRNKFKVQVEVAHIEQDAKQWINT
ncbi:MAG: phosphotransferase [Chitinophagaceae bacterium]|nr:phosphotransferase [Chitinophagaceae bacterium]